MLNDYNDKKRIIKDKKLPKSIRSVVQMYPINQINRQFYGGLPHIGNALWGSWSSDDIQAAADTYDDYSLSNNLLIEGFKHPSYNKVRFGGGSPGRFKPFPPCMNAIDQVIEERILLTQTYSLERFQKRIKTEHCSILLTFFRGDYKN